jgi:hypothetical protein
VKTNMNDIRELRPARPDSGGDKPEYMPKLPWKWIAALAAFLLLSFALYHTRENEEAARLRSAIQKTHGEQLGPIVTRYEELIGKINAWTVEAGNAKAVEQYVDPRLNLDALHRGKGLYMRLNVEDATTPEGILRGLDAETPDAIARCLGLEPQKVGELYARGSFLTNKWVEQSEGANVMKLRVIAEEIRQRSERDLPFVTEAVRSDWLLFTLQHGENRRDAPVDAYLYDLRSNKLLLRTRVEAQGALVAARIVLDGVKPGHYASGAQTGGAQDCAIANDLRAVAGKEPTTFTSDPPEPRAAYDAAHPAEKAEAKGAGQPSPMPPATPPAQAREPKAD